MSDVVKDIFTTTLASSNKTVGTISLSYLVTKLKTLFVEKKNLLDSVYPLGIVIELKSDVDPGDTIGGDWWDITSKYTNVPSDIKKWQRIINGNANKKNLQSFYDQVKGSKQEDYTEASWLPFAEALAKAKEVLEDPSVVQNTVDQTYSALVSAYLDLKKKPS